jgi:uracil-DNA glycosylase family protein
MVRARGAQQFVPDTDDVQRLRAAADSCRGCDLYRHASQVVFGEGARSAEVMLVGEQPGDKEDLAGRPFVGPAGHVLDEALERAGIDRDRTYVTNAVKHFKFTRPEGKRRLHKTPGRTEVVACRPWLVSELAAVGPAMLICLGATAAKAVLGRDFRVTKQRGTLLAPGDPGVDIDADLAAYIPRALATVHPSSILRGPAQDREANLAALVADLEVAAAAL